MTPEREYLFYTLKQPTYSRVFLRLSRALWLIFAGWTGMLGGLVIAGPVFVANGKGKHFPGETALIVVGGMLILGGYFANVVGKWRCTGLRRMLPPSWRLPGQHWLLCSLWCDFSSLSCRWLAAGLAVPQIKLLAAPLGNFGTLFFLLFLRKIADVIQAPRLKRFCEVLVALCGVMQVVLCATIAEMAVGFRGAPVMIGFAVSLLLSLAGVGLYIVFLFWMARAVAQFGHFLLVEQLDENGDLAALRLRGDVDLRVKSVQILNRPQPERDFK